jgi:hypothetical protein
MADKSVKVIVCLEVDSIFDEQSFEISDLVIGNVLLCC